MKFEEWVKGIENAAIKGLCSTHPNICKMIYNEGQKDIEKALKEKGVCLQSELDEAIETIRDFMDWYVETDISAEALPPELRQTAAAFLRR